MFVVYILLADDTVCLELVYLCSSSNQSPSEAYWSCLHDKLLLALHSISSSHQVAPLFLIIGSSYLPEQNLDLWYLPQCLPTMCDTILKVASDMCSMY